MSARRPPARHRVWAAAVTVLLASTTACAADQAETLTTRSSDALTWGDEQDLDGASLAVGAKSGGEQEVLGWIAAEALGANGADVTPVVDLGTTIQTRDALLGGLVDLYWEYTGTGWVEILREIGASTDATDLADAVAATDLDENEIAWLTPAPADSSFTIISGPDVADDLDVESLSAMGTLFEDGVDGAVLCVPEGGRFLTDPTGLASLASALDLPVRQIPVVPVPGSGIVDLVEAGAFCPFGQVTRSSPLLVDRDLRLLDDDIGAFLIRNPAVTVRAEVLAEVPEIAAVLDPVAELLSDDALRGLNADVQGGVEARTAARQWLVDEGLADF